MDDSTTQPEIPHGNKFVLLIHIKDTKIHGSKRLLSPINFLQLTKKMEKQFPKTTGDSIVLLKLVDKESGRVKTLKVKMEAKGRDTIQEIKQKMIELEEIIQIPDEEKYRVIIDNCESNKVDKRAFSMRFRGTMQDCYAGMRNFFDEIIEEIKDDDIVFLENKPEKMTHRIIIHKSGSVEKYGKEFKSKSFSIHAPNYSSEELIAIVRRKLGCEEKNS